MKKGKDTSEKTVGCLGQRIKYIDEIFKNG